jgi:hypothetical protein
VPSGSKHRAWCCEASQAQLGEATTAEDGIVNLWSARARKISRVLKQNTKHTMRAKSSAHLVYATRRGMPDRAWVCLSYPPALSTQ